MPIPTGSYGTLQLSQPSCFSVDGGTAPTGYANVTVYWYDTLHCVASSLTLESDDAGSGKGHNFCRTPTLNLQPSMLLCQAW